MKKLLMSLALLGTFAAMSAKGEGDSYLYWMVNPSDSTLQYNAAGLYAYYNGAKVSDTAITWTDNSAERTLFKGADGKGIDFSSYFGAAAQSDWYFLVELYNGDQWVSQSTMRYATALASGGIYSPLAQAGAGTVTFTSFAVPEPTSGLLMLFGLCGLALKRKRA